MLANIRLKEYAKLMNYTTKEREDVYQLLDVDIIYEDHFVFIKGTPYGDLHFPYHMVEVIWLGKSTE